MAPTDGVGELGDALRRLAARQDEERCDRGDGDDHRDDEHDDPSGSVSASGRRRRGLRCGLADGGSAALAEARVVVVGAPAPGQVRAMSPSRDGRPILTGIVSARRRSGQGHCRMHAQGRPHAAARRCRSGGACRSLCGERAAHAPAADEHERGGGDRRRRPVGERRPRAPGAPQQTADGARGEGREAGRRVVQAERGGALARSGWRARSAPCSCPRSRRCRGRRPRRGPRASSPSRRRRSLRTPPRTPGTRRSRAGTGRSGR